MRKIIASLDIGSDTLKLVVGEIYHNKLNVLAALDTPSRGVKQGYVVNVESTIEALKELFDQAELILGFRVRKVVALVPALMGDCFLTEGTIAINSESGVVTHDDIRSVLAASVHNKVELNCQIVSVLPTNFTINNTELVKNPLNLMANKLSVRSIVITIPKKNVEAISTCLTKIGVELVDVSIVPLADYAEFRTKDNIKMIGALIDIGAQTTTVAIINRGLLTNYEVLNIGGENVDHDLAYVYKLNRSNARLVKEKLALAHNRLAEARESLKLTNRNGEEIKINQYDASEIVMSRLEEILNLTKKQINLLTKREISYIIITGGLTEIADFDLVIDEIFGSKARIGQVQEVGVRHNKYAAVVGLIKDYNSKLKFKKEEFSIFTMEEQEEFSGLTKKINVSENSILGKLFGYFFDN